MVSPRSHHPVVAQAAATRYLNNPIDTLTNMVADGVGRRLEVDVRKPIQRSTNKLAASRAWDAVIKAKIKEALQEVLTADDAASQRLRLDLIAMLASVGREGLVAGATGGRDMARQENAAEDPLLSTADAAKILGFSRTYVAMLIDNGKLPGASVSDGGHRRVPQSVVVAYQVAKDARKTSKSTDYRSSGKATGMYEVSERDYVEVAKRPDSGPFRAPAAKKATRK